LGDNGPEFLDRHPTKNLRTNEVVCSKTAEKIHFDENLWYPAFHKPENRELFDVKFGTSRKMYYINRTVALLRPKQPPVDWLNELPDPDHPFTLADFQTDYTVLLLPVFGNDLQALNFLKKIYKGIFEKELNSFCTDPDYWPAKLDYKTFLQWFEIEFHPEVFDTVDKAIIKKQWD
jgi:hypothetical protein